MLSFSGRGICESVIMAGRYSRTLEETRSVIKHAKLEENELKPVSQVLHFSKRKETAENYKFIEIDNELLDILQEGQSLVFRGSKEENAVLCTLNHTYDIKEAETSNSLLLLDNFCWANEANTEGKERILQEKEVVGVFHKYFELRRCKPRFQKLRLLLEDSCYNGKDYEEELKTKGVKMYTFSELLGVIQSSEEELKAALHKEKALHIEGKWRLLEHEYHFHVLSYILNLVDENSWPLTSIPKKVTMNELCELVPVEILDQCFEWYAEPIGETDKNGDLLYKLLEAEVCRMYAEVLLRAAGNFNLKEFLLAWQQSVPEGMKTHKSYLDGIALLDLRCKPEIIKFFPETSLPEDITDRFRVLFQTKEKWTLEEICPYIQQLTSEKMNVNALLTKYARTSTVGGVKYYSAKHAK